MRRARGHAPLAWSAHDAALLARVRAHAAAAPAGAVGVFDLDGCMFDTRQRQVHILREAASTRGWAPLYRVREEHFVDWSLRRTLQLAGIDDAWTDAHLEDVRAWWHERFFASRYVEHDYAMPGAAELLRDLHAGGLDVVYLTGRHEPMRPGTRSALRRFGFPFGTRADLVMKPTMQEDDVAFKARAIEALAPRGPVVLYFDNEPANVNMYRAKHPDALVVFVETDHSPRPIEPDAAIPWLRCFLSEAV